MTLKRKLILLVVLPVLLCTTIAVFIASLAISKQGIEGLKDKSSSILSINIQEYTTHHQDYSSIFEQDEKKDSSQLNTSALNYQFKISSRKPENPKHLANETDKKFIEQFEKERSNEITHIDKESNTLSVMRPVFMDKSKGCLECHLSKED